MFGVGDPRATALFSGFVQGFTELRGVGSSFWTLRVWTLGGEVDVVVAPELITPALQVDAVIHGDFWLSGHILPNDVETSLERS
jgi:hypothetical protein